MATVPMQEWCEPYDLTIALEEGTIFPCLNFTFYKAPEGKCKCKSCSSLADKSQKTREEKMSRLAVVSFAINELYTSSVSVKPWKWQKKPWTTRTSTAVILNLTKRKQVFFNFYERTVDIFLGSPLYLTG